MTWRRIFHRKYADLDHAEEVRCHIEIDIDDNIANGMSADDARRAAYRKFGNPTSLREEVYTMNTLGFFETLGRDLRYSTRVLLRHPGFTAAAVLCLALGIGATTAIFSVVNAVLLRPLPYAHADRIERLYTASTVHTDPNADRFWFSQPEFASVRREATSFSSIDAWFMGGANVSGGQEPIRPSIAYVTGGLMQSLGVAPLRGRLVTPEDDTRSAPYSAVISYGLWQRAFGGDPAMLNRELLFSGRKCTIVGIMPPDFQFPPGEPEPIDIWAPAQLGSPAPGSQFNHFLSVMGVLKPGVTPVRARQEMQTVLKRIEASEGASNHLGLDVRAHTVVMYPFQEEVVGNARGAIWIMMGAVAFVLIISCVNVANLLLARAETRRREIAIRKAIGAGLSTLVRQFMAEGLLLSTVGAVFGLAICFAGIRLLVASNAGSIPRAAEIGINWGVLLFTLALSCLTGIAFGLAPIAQLIGRNLHDTLKSATSRNSSTRGANRFRQALVVSELALALVLLIATGLMVRAFWKLMQVDVGINSHNLLTMTTTLPGGVYPKADRVAQFWANAQQRASAIPGVISATLMSGLPPMRRVDSNTTPIEGYTPPNGRPAIEIDFYQTVGPRFFETLQARLIEGRFFDERDVDGAQKVVIINQSLARKVWPNASALGHRLGLASDPSTIVGVVGDIKNGGVDQPAGTEAFFSYLQFRDNLRAPYLVLRTNAQPSAISQQARAVIRSIDPGLPINKLREMDDVIASVRSRPRLLTALLTSFACVALLLATIGIYGVISYSVAQRTNEFGIRIAMGASSSDVLRMVLRKGLLLSAAGLGIGAAGAFALTRFLSGFLFGVSAVDPVTFAAMIALLGIVTILASYIPARRATKVDPTIALRYE